MRLHAAVRRAEALYKRYQGKGLVVPASRVTTSARRSKTNKEIAEFRKANYGVSFPMFEKPEVPIGKHPLFAGLIAKLARHRKWELPQIPDRPQGRRDCLPSDVEPQSPVLVKAVDSCTGQLMLSAVAAV